MKYFVILLILIGFVSTVFAIPEFTDPEKVYGADVIVIGQILSYYDEGKYRFYEISILKELKNSVSADTITMRSINESSIFETGDPVLLYLKDYGRGFWESTNFSEKILDGRLQYTIKRITELVEQTEKQSPEPPSESVVTNSILNQSPLKQFKSGIFANAITCKEGLMRFIEFNGKLICVKPQTMQKLTERGLAQKSSGVVSSLATPGHEFKTSLTVEGLNKTYSVGQKIEFTLHAEKDTDASYFQELNTFIPLELTYEKSDNHYILTDKR